MYKETVPNLEFSAQPCFKRIFSNCLSHKSLSRGSPYRFFSRGTTWSSILDHDLGNLCRGRRIQNVWTLRFWIFEQFVSIFHFHLGISWYCVCCLSIATWQSGDDIHDLGGCHLRCWRSLFSEYCTRPRVIFHNVTSEYNSTFVFLVLSFLKWQMSINDAKWTFAPDVLASSITSDLFLTFVSCHAGIFSDFHILSPLLLSLRLSSLLEA